MEEFSVTSGPIVMEETLSARVAQGGLKQLGLYTGRLDNVWGPASAAAFTRFARGTRDASAQPSEDKHSVYIFPANLANTLVSRAQQLTERAPASSRSSGARAVSPAPEASFFDKLKANWKLALAGAVLGGGLLWYMKRKR